MGFGFAFWYIAAQIDIGRGTPLPMMPTQQLVVQKPFTFYRNPMTLGTILVYSALVVWLGSISAAVIVTILLTLLLLYIKQIEEKELEARFVNNQVAGKATEAELRSPRPEKANQSNQKTDGDEDTLHACMLAQVLVVELAGGEHRMDPVQRQEVVVPVSR